MDTQKINDWLQVVGTFGVIASLILVGLQMKQAREIALSNVYQARSDATVNSLVSEIGSPEYLSAASKMHANRPEDLSAQEATALDLVLGAEFTMFENNHRQYEMGYLSEEHWQRNIAEIKCYLNVPLEKEFIMQWHFRSSFMNLLNNVIRENAEHAPDCPELDVDWPYPIDE